jgi:hypothetical protein
MGFGWFDHDVQPPEVVHHPLAKPMSSSAKRGTGSADHMGTVRFDVPGPDGTVTMMKLSCPNSPVNLISLGATVSINDKLVVKETNREPTRIYWNNNVAMVPSYAPTSLDIEYNIDKMIITFRGQKEPLQELQQDVPDSTASKNQKDKTVTEASGLLTKIKPLSPMSASQRNLPRRVTIQTPPKISLMQKK